MDLLFSPTQSHVKAQRYEYVFLILAGLFLSTLAIINLLGLSRFVDLSISWGQWTLPMQIPLGVLPYPLTFLCTDLISEFYGKKRANLVVSIGLLVNIWILFLLWLGGLLPPQVTLDAQTHLPATSHSDFAFFQMRLLTLGSVFGSMLAYVVAQFLDVHLFHFWKNLTQGKHLWLRNNASTLISQLVDTSIVVIVAYLCTNAVPMQADKSVTAQLGTFILSIYIFKAFIALLDTVPFYLTVFYLRRYFGLTAKKPLATQKLSVLLSIKSPLH